MTGEKKKVRSSGPWEGPPNPQASPWDAWQRGPAPRVEFPASDGHRGDTRHAQLAGRGSQPVLTNLSSNWAPLTPSSRKTTQANILSPRPRASWRTCKIL